METQGGLLAALVVFKIGKAYPHPLAVRNGWKYPLTMFDMYES